MRPLLGDKHNVSRKGQLGQDMKSKFGKDQGSEFVGLNDLDHILVRQAVPFHASTSSAYQAIMRPYLTHLSKG